MYQREAYHVLIVCDFETLPQIPKDQRAVLLYFEMTRHIIPKKHNINRHERVYFNSDKAMEYNVDQTLQLG